MVVLCLWHRHVGVYAQLDQCDILRQHTQPCKCYINMVNMVIISQNRSLAANNDSILPSHDSYSITYTLPCCRLTKSPTQTIVCTHQFSSQRKPIPMHIFHHVHGKARTCTRAQNRTIFFSRSSLSILTKPLGDYD